VTPSLEEEIEGEPEHGLDEDKSPSASVSDRLKRNVSWYKNEFDRGDFEMEEIEAMAYENFSKVEGMEEEMGSEQILRRNVSAAVPFVGLSLSEPVLGCMAPLANILLTEQCRRRTNKRRAYHEESYEALRDMERRRRSDGRRRKRRDAAVRAVDEAGAESQNTTSSTDAPSISWQEIRNTNLEEDLEEQQLEFHGDKIRGHPHNFIKRLCEDDYEIDRAEARESTEGGYEVTVYGQHILDGEAYDSGQPPLRFETQERYISEFEEPKKPDTQRPEARMEEPEPAKN
jgi:hypothetical protein